MPISSPQPALDPAKLHRKTLRRLACLLLTLTCAAPAQILARPGHDYGFKADPWWKRAVFYEVGTAAGPGGAGNAVDFREITARLDALKSLGVDALILPAPALPPPGAISAAPDSSLDALDDLLRQAGGHGIRVLLTLHPASATADLSGLARFWLNRGVAGLYIAAPAGAAPEQTQAMLQTLRKAASGVLGQRIVISDLAPLQTAQPVRHASSGRSSRAANSSAVELQIDTRASSLAKFDAASVRPLLAQAIDRSNLLLELRAPASASTLSPLAAVAAITLTTSPAALIDSSAHVLLEPTPERPVVTEQPETPAKPTPIPPQPPPGVYLPYVPYVPPAKPKPAELPTAKPKSPPDPFTEWLRQLAALHHDNAVLRNGSKVLLDFDAQNALAWVVRPAPGPGFTAPLVVVCNLSAAPVQLSLAEDIKRLNLHGDFLRPLLRSYQAMGAQDVNAVTVPAYGVFIGELRR